jgi:ABC-type sulfate/molybdate transport systems ATPase subunit
MLKFEELSWTIPSGPQVTLSGQIGAQEAICLRGPSGCGKTTSLRVLAGLRKARSGKFLCADRDLTESAPEIRRAGFLMQGPQLIPFMNVEENLCFALGIRHPDWAPSLRSEKAREVLIRAKIESLIHSPAQSLSGGEAQRVAFCRILLSEPEYWLFDEPFTGLDPENRTFFQNWLKDELKLRPRPTVMVSHEVSDATALGARVIEWPKDSAPSLHLRF